MWEKECYSRVPRLSKTRYSASGNVNAKLYDWEKKIIKLVQKRGSGCFGRFVGVRREVGKVVYRCFKTFFRSVDVAALDFLINNIYILYMVMLTCIKRV